MAFIPYLASFLLPIVVIVGNCLGGNWTLAGLILLFGLYPLLDIALGKRRGHTGMTVDAGPWGELILRLHVLVQLCVVGVLLWRAYRDGAEWTTFFAALSTAGAGGASGIIVAHELGHRRPRSFSWWLSRLNLMSVCYSHYTIEHNHNHHLNVGTDADPASVPLGRGLWSQVVFTIPRQYLSAWRIQENRSKAGSFNPMLRDLLVQVGLVVAFGLLLSWWVALAFLVQAFFAVLLLEYVNYIRHYGLRRGSEERQTEQHSWQTEARWTGWTLFEVSLHPDHHLRTNLPFWRLDAISSAPTLPVGYYGLFWACAFPPLWRRWMDPKVPSASH